MRLTRDNLDYWKDTLKEGDLIEFDVPYAETKQALVISVNKRMNSISVEHDLYKDQHDITRAVRWTRVMQIWTRENDPERFL